jgi:hypothetical protein
MHRYHRSRANLEGGAPQTLNTRASSIDSRAYFKKPHMPTRPLLVACMESIELRGFHDIARHFLAAFAWLIYAVRVVVTCRNVASKWSVYNKVIDYHFPLVGYCFNLALTIPMSFRIMLFSQICMDPSCLIARGRRSPLWQLVSCCHSDTGCTNMARGTWGTITQWLCHTGQIFSTSGSLDLSEVRFHHAARWNCCQQIHLKRWDITLLKSANKSQLHARRTWGMHIPEPGLRPILRTQLWYL